MSVVGFFEISIEMASFTYVMLTHVHYIIIIFIDMFMNKLMMSDCIPLFLWDNDVLLNHIQDIFHEYDNSIVSTARRLKKELGRYFSLPGKGFRFAAAIYLLVIFPYI